MAFKIFRLVAGLVLGACAAYLAVTGVLSLFNDQSADKNVVLPIIEIVGAVVLMGVYYYAFWTDSNIHRVVENIMSIPELLKKIAFTLALLCIYRIGFHVPLPGIDSEALAELMGGQDENSPFGQAIQYFGMFTGGTLDNSTLFGLGIMPYISASIILQLLTTVVPALQKLQKEGQAGRKKIQEYTRYLTVALCLVQAAVWMKVMMGMGGDSGMRVIYSSHTGSLSVFLMGILGLTAGTCFLMWLGEQIDEYGIGNGISLLIMAGILARLPFAIKDLYNMSSFDITSGGGKGRIGPIEILFLIGSFVFVVAGAILITQGQRRIPIQQAKQTRGRRVYGGQRHYMPLRVNHGGVMPIIFASSLMIFPSLLFGWLDRSVAQGQSKILAWLDSAFRTGQFTYEILYVGMIFFFAYFWTSVIFRPKEMAEQLRDMGHFIPGLRPGKRTADYLERVMERITYCGAAFLSIIAVIPTVVNSWMGIPFQVSAFLGGTGLLIVVSVCLDLVQRIESNLVMRNYGGFLGGSTRIKGAYS